jgi:hypothetical protein
VGGLFSGLVKSTDGGDSWKEVDFGMPDVRLFVDRSSRVTALAIDPHSNTVYAAAGRMMLKSVDGGASWIDVNARPDTSSGNGIETLAIDPRDPNTLYAATGDGVFAINFVP